MKKEEIQTIVLIVMGFLLLFGVTHFLFISPKAAALKNIRQKLDSLQKELRTSQGIAKNETGIQKEKEETSKKIKEYRKALITQSEFDFFRNTVRDMGAEYDVKVLRDNTRVIDDNEKTGFQGNFNYTEKEISLQLACSYHDFGGFLNRIEYTSPFRSVDEISMLKSRGRRRVGGGDGEPSLTISMKIQSLLFELGERA